MSTIAGSLSVQSNHGIDVISLGGVTKYSMLCAMVVANAASDHNVFTNENAMLITECVSDFFAVIDHIKYSPEKIVTNFNLDTANYDEVVARRIVQEMNYYCQRNFSDDMFFVVRPYGNGGWRFYVAHQDILIDLRCAMDIDTEYSDDFSGVYAIYARLTLI